MAGRLEHVGGRLLYLPPCGDHQQDVALSLAGVLDEWRRTTPGFVAGANEAGLLLGGEARGADAAVWTLAAAGQRTGGYRRVAPVLAAEIAGRDEGEAELRSKAQWYLDHGVLVVWLLFPATREVLVIRRGSERRFGQDATLPESPEPPGLAPPVERFFAQLDAR